MATEGFECSGKESSDVGDQMKTGDKTEGTSRCLQKGDDGKVSCRGAYVGESPSDRLEGDHSAGP